MIFRAEVNFGGAARRELDALARERDPQFYQLGLWNLAQRLEQENRVGAAVELYAELAAAKDFSPTIARAQGRLEVLRGGGTFGARAELFLRGFAREAASPAAIFAMGAAGLAFRATRLAVLGRLAASPTAGFWTRGLGRVLTAGAAGFGAETATFTLAGKGAATLLGETTDWTPRGLAREWAGGALLLGSLKAAGGLTHFGLNHWAVGSSGLERLTRSLAPTAARFGGIVAGQGMERSLGLKPAASASGALLDALTTLVHLQVGGALAGRVWGERFRSLERRLDFAAAAATQGPEAWSSSPAFAMAGRSHASLPPRPLDPLAVRPMLAQSLGEGGGGAEVFRTVNEISTAIARGKILLDLGSRKPAISRELMHRMYTLEDAFTSLLHNYHTQETRQLKGPLVALLRQDEFLRRHLLSYGSDPAKRLWAFIDADNGELQRIAGFDSQFKLHSLIFWDTRSDSGRPDSHSAVVTADFGYHRPEFPVVISNLFAWDPQAKQLRQDKEVPAPRYNGMSMEEAYRDERSAAVLADPNLEIRVLPGTPQEIRYRADRSVPLAWRVEDATGQLLFSLRREPGEGGHFFQYSQFAPPLAMPEPGPEPLRSRPKPPAPAKTKAVQAEPAPPPKPAALPAKEKAKPAKTPPSPPATGAAARAMLALTETRDQTPQGIRKALGALRVELKLAGREDLEQFCEAVEKTGEIFYRFGEIGTDFLRREIPKLPSPIRLRLAKFLTTFLTHEMPPYRSVSFDIFRDFVVRMSFDDLRALDQFLAIQFPPGKLRADRDLMVRQVRLKIQEQIPSGGGAPVPPAGLLAIVAGLGTLAHSSVAEASTLDFLGSAANPGMHPGAAAMLYAAIATFALRSPPARFLASQALTLGSAILSRLTDHEAPVLLDRPKRHPYQLQLGEIEDLLRPERSAVIARREGREILLKTGEVHGRIQPFEPYPPGTLRVPFTLEEGDTRGGGILFIEPDAINLYNIQTRFMKDGVGTILLDYLATQAARRGLEFRVRAIHNPQIFHILRKHELMADPRPRVEGKYHEPFVGPVWYEGSIEDPFLQREHDGAAFDVRGKPNPALLPFYLRTDRRRPILLP